MSTITHIYEYNFKPCTEMHNGPECANGVPQEPCGSVEHGSVTRGTAAIFRLNGPIPPQLKDTYNQSIAVTPETRELYKLEGFAPPELIHMVETREGSIFGDVDHVIIRWKGATLEGVLAICDNLELPKNCVVETRYKSSTEELFGNDEYQKDKGGEKSEDNLRIHTVSTNHRYNGISVPGIEGALAIFGDLIPIELAESIDITESIKRRPYYSELFPEGPTGITDFNRSAVVYWSASQGAPRVAIDSRFVEIEASEEPDTWTHFIARKCIQKELFAKLKELPTDFYHGLRWGLQMH
jgi:hypothetical protein